MAGDHVVMQGDDFFCGHCGARYTMNLPAPVLVYTAALQAFAEQHERCPANPRVAEQEKARLEAGFESPAAWARGPDTGISSMTIWHVLTGKPMPNGWHPGVPWDRSDFGRCHRLVKAFGWRARLPEVAARYPEWAPLVREWDRLEALYDSDETGVGAALYKLMCELVDEGRKGAGR